MNKFKQKQLARSISLILAGSAVPVMIVTPAQAQEAGGAVLEEIVVTAQKREQNLQDVAVSIQVLDNESLENLNIRAFADMIDFMPTVAFASGGATGGPGFGQVYMRGIASGGDGNHSTSMPSVVPSREKEWQFPHADIPLRTSLVSDLEMSRRRQAMSGSMELASGWMRPLSPTDGMSGTSR